MTAGRRPAEATTAGASDCRSPSKAQLFKPCERCVRSATWDREKAGLVSER